MSAIEMFFDHTCPYCYRGHAMLKSLLTAFPAAEILWRPIEAHPKVEEPYHKPYEDLAVQGALFVRTQHGDELAYHERIYRAQFEEHLKVDDPDTLASLAEELGYDRAAFRKALADHTYEAAQRAANDYAYEQNKVWAVPTFVCGGKRLDAVEGRGITKEGLEAFLKLCCCG